MSLGSQPHRGPLPAIPGAPQPCAGGCLSTFSSALQGERCWGSETGRDFLPSWSGWVPNLCPVRRPHSLALPEPQLPLPSREPLQGLPQAPRRISWGCSWLQTAEFIPSQFWRPDSRNRGACLPWSLLPAFSGPWWPQASLASVFTGPPSWCLSGSPNLISLSLLSLNIYFYTYLFGCTGS